MMNCILKKKTKMMIMTMIFCLLLTNASSSRITEKKDEDPKPKPWPEQFHSVLVMNNTKKNELQVTDLWYDWPNGRNLNLIQNQLGKLLYDLEWNNGTSYYYTLDATSECRTLLFEVGILRPNWLEGATYLGQKHMDGFLCNVWEKVDFIWYYEDVVTRRPVYWLFYTGLYAHVITFEEGVVLEDSRWQAPVYCFNKKAAEEEEEEEKQQETAGYPHQFLRDAIIIEKKAEDPKPKPWPEQFHSVLVINNTKKNELQVTDLWYDWPNGRNLNLIQKQLGKLLYDVEWNNGTSYYYTLDATSECRTVLFEVGILRPNWLEGATYLGQKHMDGFLCNVWQKVDFLWYYEDVVTRRPVYWLFYTGRAVHVITFEEGVVLEDSQWQAPVYCFNKKEEEEEQQQQQIDGYPHQFLRDIMPLAFT